VSAAVSDESVAGDSGVFEASNKKRSSLASDNAAGLEDMNLETAQVQIKLRYTSYLLTYFLLHASSLRANSTMSPVYVLS